MTQDLQHGSSCDLPIYGSNQGNGAAILGQVGTNTSGLSEPAFWMQFAGASIFGGAGGAGAALFWPGAALIVTPGVTAAGTTVVIGTLSSLSGSLGPDGSVLLQVPSTIYSWSLNEQLLQAAMSLANPIRDLIGVGPVVPGSMLEAERQMLSGAGWILQQAQDGYYYWIKL